MKKFIISLIILLIFGAAVFFIGWIQIYIPVDSVAVLVSKTSGVKNEIIQAGEFTWSWERLLPTNTEIRTFSLNPKKYTENITGTLPSAEFYKQMIEGEPDFNFNFSVDITMNIKKEKLPELVKNAGIQNQEDLESYLSVQSDTIAQSVITHVLENSVKDNDYVMQVSLSDTELITGINASKNYSNLEIISIKINNTTLPDIALYKQAKESYTAYQNAIQTHINEAAILQGKQASKDYLEIERLTRLGKVLAEYPEIVDFMSVTKGNTDFNIPLDLSSLAN